MTDIKEYRLRNNLTQQELADLLEVTRVTVARWESGESEPSDLPKYRIEQLLAKEKTIEAPNG